MNNQLDNYKIPSRAEDAIRIFGSVELAIKATQKELDEYESSWGMYSSDCLGHAITCNRMIIDYLKR